MKIAILGAGFTGLAAALRLSQTGHKVTVFEKDAQVGGLAGGFKDPLWDWTLEKSYHHLFTNDKTALSLAQELNLPVIVKRPQTNVYIEDKSINGKALPFDSLISLLKFPYLPLIDRLRVGIAMGYLKYLSSFKSFEGYLALPWIKKFMGEKSLSLIWDPLFTGKFGQFKDSVSLTWFWARIKKRTPSLVYPEGGFQNFAQKLADQIKILGGKIVLNSEVIGLDNNLIKLASGPLKFDKTIVTLPTPTFLQITPSLPKSYTNQLSSIPHLSALNLILVLKKPFLKDTYWLNITDTKFPFLVLAEQTNFMDPLHYNNQHILYIGNYLAHDHHYLKLSAQELLKIYNPFLSRINPKYKMDIVHSELFHQPFAQPVVTTDYLKLIPEIQTPLKNVYLANLDMVYPWDRGINYAIDLGEKVAEFINKGKE